jgi:MFS family permease
MPWINNYLGIALLAALYGFTISANYALVSVILVNLISLDSFTNAYGLLLLVQGFGSLVGPPIAGLL